MKLPQNFFGKFLVALLTLVSLGGNFTYGFSFTDVRQRTEDQSDQEDNLKSTRSLVLAFQENDFRDLLEPSEDFFFNCIPSDYSSLTPTDETAPASTDTYYDRDLRAVLTVQIIPPIFSYDVELRDLMQFLPLQFSLN